MIIRAITKTSKKVLDKYIIYMWDASCLSLSDNCDSPQGVSQWAEGCFSDGELDLAANSNLKLSQDEILINFYDLPQNVQEHAKNRIRQN